MSDSRTLLNRVCDYCNKTTALIYCKADTAKLCLSCDREVHSTNELFSKHTRSLLCDSCNNSPVSIFCETEHSVLCHNCDWEKHSNNANELVIHNRRPIEGYIGCPSVSEFMAILGFDDPSDKKALFFSIGSDGFIDGEGGGVRRENGFLDLLIWKTPAVVGFNDLIVSSGDLRKDFKAVDVPPLPKNRNASCGKRKEQILYQLRELASAKPNTNHEDSDSNNLFQLLSSQIWQPKHAYAVRETGKHPISIPTEEENVFHWLNDSGDDRKHGFVCSTLANSLCDENSMVPDKLSNIGGTTSHATNADCEEKSQHSLVARSLLVSQKIGSRELNSQERDSAISRYKEKRKTRRYDKHIRYESRKARAESRTRIRGRFAKV